MVGTPFAKVGIEAESHHAGGVRETIDRQLLDRDLCFGGLELASERHEHR